MPGQLRLVAMMSSVMLEEEVHCKLGPSGTEFSFLIGLIGPGVTVSYMPFNMHDELPP